MEHIGMKSWVDPEKNISIKALVDTEKNRILCVESYEDFVDVLFSFLTMPMGTIVRLTRDQIPTAGIGCMNNLYTSVENLDAKHLRNETCKTMLLQPQNAAAAHCKSLKLNVDDGGPCLKHFLWVIDELSCSSACRRSCIAQKELSEIEFKRVAFDARDGGVFVKGLTRHLITDKLQVITPSNESSFSLLSCLQAKEASAVEESTFDIGLNEVLNLLKCSFESKKPLTDTLLKRKSQADVIFSGIPLHSKEDSCQRKSVITKHHTEECVPKGNGKICAVRLMVSKSKNVVCYAEAGEDFIDLLFSFLTIPLGYILKEMHGGPSKGCIHQLYKSVQDLDSEKYLKSIDHKEILLNPKIAPGFGYGKQLLSVEEVPEKQSYHSHWTSGYYPVGNPENPEKVAVLTVMDPRSPYKKANVGEGFVIGPAMFTVTDDLTITPISPVSGVSDLNKLQVPFNDVEEQVIQVGNEEALHLLVASFASKCALTEAFILRRTKQGDVCSLVDNFPYKEEPKSPRGDGCQVINIKWDPLRGV